MINSPPDHAQSSYRVSADGSFLVTLASGMELSLSTEPLLPGGAGGGVSPTASRCNISLPGDHAPSLIEWRQRKEQSKTNYSTYERRLRVKLLITSDNAENPDSAATEEDTIETVNIPAVARHHDICVNRSSTHLSHNYRECRVRLCNLTLYAVTRNVTFKCTVQ